MKCIQLAIIVLFSGVAAMAQSSDPPLPGMAGHRDCKAYFGVMWLDGVQAGQSQQATHFGLSEQQLEWWKSAGYTKARGLCYLSPALDSTGKLDLQCPGCTADWSSRFRWVVFEHVDAKDQRSLESGQIVNGQLGATGRVYSSRPTTAVSASDPNTRVDYKVAVVSTNVAVYGPYNPVRPPTGQDPQLFYDSEQKDKSSKNSGAQVAANDRMALQAAAKFILKNVKH